MSAFGDQLSKRKVASTDVSICLDGELASQHEQLAADLMRAAKDVDRLRKNPPADQRSVGSPVRDAEKAYEAVAHALADVEAEMRDTSITLRVRAVPFADYQAFVLKNAPRPGKNEVFNPLTFFLYVARRSAVYVDPEGAEHSIEEHEWVKLEKDLTDGEHEKLAQAILEVNRNRGLQGTAFLSRSSVSTPSSSPTSEQPAPKASPRSGSGAGSRAKSTRTSTTKRAG